MSNSKVIECPDCAEIYFVRAYLLSTDKYYHPESMQKYICLHCNKLIDLEGCEIDSDGS